MSLYARLALLALVLRAGAVADLGRLRAAFDIQLAHFKHPRRIEVFDALPRTVLGKVRKSELAQRLA